MRKASFLAFALLFCSMVSAEGVHLQYVVDVAEPEANQVHVTLVIQDLPESNHLSLFVQSTSVMGYVTNVCVSPGVCPMKRYQSHIANLSVRDQSGDTLGVERIIHGGSDGRFVDERRISLAGASIVTVEYDVTVLYPFPVRKFGPGIVNMAAYLDERYGLLNESYVFFRPDPNGSWPGRRSVAVRAVDIRFALPEDWRAVSVWAGDSSEFGVPDPVRFCERHLDSLGGIDTNGPFLGLGPYRVLSRLVGETEVVAATVDDPAVPAEYIADLVFYAFERIYGLLGEYPGDRFVFYTVSDYAPHESGMRALRHVVWAPRLKFSSAWNYRVDNEAWLLYPDEILWEWCEELNFGEFEHESATMWFTDGAIVNTYYKIALESGHIEVSDYYGQYVRCLELYEKERSHLTPLIGLALDELIQAETGGRASIQDVFRTLYEQHGRGAYTNADIQQVLQAVTGDRFESFFQEIVYPQRVPQLATLSEYREYPDLAIHSNEIRWIRSAEGGVLEIPVHNYGRQGAEADVRIFAGLPWQSGVLLKSIPLSLLGGRQQTVRAELGSWPEGVPPWAYIEILNVRPGDLDTRRLQKAIVEVHTGNAAQGSQGRDDVPLSGQRTDIVVLIDGHSGEWEDVPIWHSTSNPFSLDTRMLVGEESLFLCFQSEALLAALEQGGTVEIRLRHAGSCTGQAVCAWHQHICEGTGSGWELLNENLQTRERGLLGALPAQSSEILELAIPLAKITENGKCLGFRIAVVVTAGDGSGPYIFHFPNMEL